MNRNADLRIGALGAEALERADSEIGAPTLRFIFPMHARQEGRLSMTPRAAASRQSAAKSIFGNMLNPNHFDPQT